MVKRVDVLRRLVLAIALLLSLGVMASISVDAAFVSCRADPLVFLSNGDTIKIVASMETPASNVKSINYVLHVPPGVSVTKVVYTGGPVAGKEALQVFGDAPANSYTTDTLVTTRTSGVQVTATTSLRGQRVSVSGFDRQTLSVTLQK